MAPPYSSTGYNAFTLNPNSINSIHIVDGAITAADIGDLGITGADIANETIGLTKLDASLNTLINAIGVIVPDSINSSHIVDGSILGTDISNNTITNSNIADLTISQNKFSQVFLDRINTIESSIGYIPPNSVNSSHIVNGSILTADICDNAITIDKLAPNSVNSSHIINGSILGTDISNTTISASNIINKTITATQIADETITASQIMNDTITKFKIADGAITSLKLASSAVLGINIANGVVNSSHIATGSILGEDISNGTITKFQIADNAITDSKLATDSVINSKIAINAVTTDKILDNAIITQKINDLAVTNNKIGDNAINEIKLATNAVSTNKIIDLNVTEGKLSTAVQTKLNLAGTIPANYINSSHIIDGSILTADISDNAITVDKLALGSVIGNRIVNGSITTDKIDFYQVTGNRMANNTITTTQLDASINTILNNVSLKANIANPTFTGTVGGITKTMVGLSNVDNTSDLLKPVSTATQTALNLKANLASPTFTGIVNLPSTVIAGHCVPSINNTYLLGGSSYFWNAIYGVTLHFFFTVVYSDDRLKHNEAIIINGLDIIDKLTPKFYQKTFEMLDADYNGDLSANTWNYEAGLIAQEVLKIPDLSFCVSGGDYYDENNNLIKEPYSVNYNNIFMYGLAATKELHKKVKAQETIINSLIARLEVLERS